MILTLTPNPSVDRTVVLDSLVVGSVNRSPRSWSEPSGKGVNVALALHAHGQSVRAVVPTGGSVGAQLRQMLDTSGLDAVTVPIDGEVRSNISLIQADGSTTKINEFGPTLTAPENDRLIEAVVANLEGVSWLVCGGSLPAGAPLDLYATLAEIGHAHGVRVVVDSSGAPLAASLRGRPHLIKPNTHELAELVGRSLRTLGDVVDAAHEVRAQGAEAVLTSLGADGALLVDETGTLHGEAPVDRVVSTVGAGDAMLAGFLSTDDRSRHSLIAALAWGAAAVQHEGTLFTPADRPSAVTLHENLDRGRTLADADEASPSTARSAPMTAGA